MVGVSVMVGVNVGVFVGVKVGVLVGVEVAVWVGVGVGGKIHSIGLLQERRMGISAAERSRTLCRDRTMGKLIPKPPQDSEQRILYRQTRFTRSKVRINFPSVS
jgi:hypothetical protein